MGVQHSTRRISVENDEPAIITVSSSVVERLSFQNSSKDVPPPMEQIEESSTVIRGKSIYGSKQAFDEEIQKHNEYWDKRLAKQQDAHEKMNKILEREYIKANEEMNKLLPPKLANPETRTYLREKSKHVMTCLQKNRQQPLVCSKEVEAFSECMQHLKEGQVA
ncbi:uncharacterized protein LOC106662034 [Cimex lectularius]|uniref:MICOS complex subunit MIC19 n=1 Tax=Cimex lectularius TaxID=79782 RepID=A0A8I6TDA9_CIMLE|nr:uncharacterized protein LOC106662034 [Cimex lectularius]